MAKIHVLNAETIDKIAAGEVVERPGSVVKELVENAIDAGATAVTVEAKDGGIEFIRVTDNGYGMEREQLRTAFLRHATSKIQDADDLMQVASLGFRGEALSSIAAVAKVEVITRTKDSITGSRILLEGAKEMAFDEVGAPEGTTFLMRNLFYNTPVRRKFLKQPATEGGYIADLMEHLALSRPDISFKLVLGNQMKFHTSGNGDLREVIYRIYGRDAANALVPVSAEREGIRVEGYLGKPVQIRSNRNFEIYFINGRFIRSNVVAKAVEEGYKEYLMQHKFPFCVLHIRMEPGCVDVNVHPTKMDVRFSNAMEFSGFLTQTVRDTLRGREMIPEASLSTERERKAELAAERETSPAAAPEPFEQRRSQAYRVMEEEKYTARNPVRQDFAHNPVWARVKAENSVSTPVPSPESPKAINVPENSVESNMEEDFFIETTEIPEDMEPKVEARNPIPDERGNVTGQNVEEPEKTPESSNDTGIGSDTVTEGVQMNLFEEKILTLENRSRFRIVGQVFETYWLVEFEDKLLMIDQHAAHEKVNYERMMKRYREKSVLSQGLFPPVIVSLSGQEESVLKEHRETFSALGFEMEEFGGSEYALRSVPVDLYGCNAREMFLEVLDGLLEGNGFGNIRVIEEKIASMSCKAAVKGNRRLSLAEAETLIDELLPLDNPYHCPHGRPTIVTMTKTEMERKFKRIVS
ncbi:DNA mismatch repair endonuclease MutL [Acetatifactor muris]|uniref:DNA mismatch repair protein MutL n=1 Tax=Acetatifactor muris TaxID=879566 RepID=A0A2K4ZJS8_9FIRM|nr:DNA mismatch repair endonuclease MutL [Acetatifactor muris]MCR2048947.1 DNA mismatch repair endonuclease MutL [Acetatifactor muris]SOY30656.1 DNA mismatch repair protein MutL [Acetatifactor muris]